MSFFLNQGQCQTNVAQPVGVWQGKVLRHLVLCWVGACLPTLLCPPTTAALSHSPVPPKYHRHVTGHGFPQVGTGETDH